VAGDLAARYLRSFTLHQGLFPTDLDDARTLLSTVNSTVRSMRVSYVIQAVFNETLRAVCAMFALTSAYEKTQMPDLQPENGSPSPMRTQYSMASMRTISSSWRRSTGASCGCAPRSAPT
jgi:hypothetical protein